MSKKEVIYVDIEDDITTIIDKATSSSAHIIALVLPKRYATLKSSVNMKLLKKTTAKSRKKIVLITGDESLLPLAGSTGLFVAETLKSRPVVPEVVAPSAKKELVVEPEESEEDTELDPEAAIGELDGDPPSKKVKKKSSDKSSKIKNIKESSKIRVPNFNVFRVRFIVGVLLIIALAVGWYVAFYVVPKADVVIKAQTSRVATKVEFTVDPKAESDDLETKTVIGQTQKITKRVTERFEATGEKNVGEKATGQITVQNCDSSSSLTVGAGTTFTDNTTGFGFVSDAEVIVPGGSFNGGGCSTPGEATVAVTAVTNGDTRNLSARSYSVEGHGAFISGFGSDMTGGTSKIVEVVTADDINKAEKLLEQKTDPNIKAELAALFKNDEVILGETFKTSNDTPESSVQEGAETKEGSVSATFTYTIVGVGVESLSAILEQEQLSKVDESTQSILDNGVERVELKLKQTVKGKYIVTGSTDGYVGPDINVEQLAQDITGKRFSEASDIIADRPGVNEVDLELTPFWVFSIPSTDKVTITVEISDDNLQ